MMEKIYDTSYLQLFYLPAKRAIYVVWKPASQMMNENDYMREMENYIALLKQYKPLLYMNDLREFYFTIAPDLQTWIGEKFQQLYADPSMPTDTLSAIVMSKDIFAHVSVEQTIEESAGDRVDTFERLRYFVDAEAAEEWLGLR